MQKIVEQNEGIPDPRFSDIQSSLPPKIIPNRIAREQEFNIDDRLAQPSARTGNAAMPTNPDTLLKEVGEEAPKQYVNILQQQDGEQVPSQALPQEDATQQRGVKDQPLDSASQFIQGQMQQGQSKDQMSEEVQELNDEIIKGLKYVVGAT
ncbi:MAG: hypothetical protein EZS28_043894, partial [Streblomastix strix]